MSVPMSSFLPSSLWLPSSGDSSSRSPASWSLSDSRVSSWHPSDLANDERKSMKYKYADGLLDNARGFVESAVDYARQDQQEQWKFAILHLTTALELLLKARLAIEDPKALVAGSAQIRDWQFDRGDFQSIGINECIKKLTRIYRVSFQKRQHKVLDMLRGLRNRVVHHITPTDSNELKVAVGAGLNLFIEINNAEFPDEKPFSKMTMSDLAIELRKYDEFLKERLACLAEQFHSYTRPRTHYTDECSHCLQDATVIDGDDIRCLFCGQGVSIQEFAELRSIDGSVETCRECGSQSVAKHQGKDREATYECFCCGYFRGPEIKWRDCNGEEIPRLHPVGR